MSPSKLSITSGQRGSSAMTADRTFWESLAPEIRLMILKAITQDGNCARVAPVCREWQEVIEQKTFSRLKLTPSRIAGLRNIAYRQRGIVRYIWLCIELQEYDCSQCEDFETEIWQAHNNAIISRAIQELFCILSEWEPNGSLFLDISAHSPSDPKHHFKYLHFESDAVSDPDDIQEMAKIHDPHHDWVHGERVSLPSKICISRLFEVIETAPDFWLGLPEVTAVTSLLLRRQTRRRWDPEDPEALLAPLPRLQEIYYEPWRECTRMEQLSLDESTRCLFKSLIPNRLRRIVLFEDFNDDYITKFQSTYEHIDAETVRRADVAVSAALAEASLDLEHLSASFIVDARAFFQAIDSTWIWSNLLSLSLTSRLLVSGESRTKIDDMHQAAAAAAMKMPRLNAMELWNGGKGLACVFRYQACPGHRSAAITWRGNWDLPLEPQVIRSWQAVALRGGRHELHVVKETLDSDSVINSHGDAIQNLKLLNQVVHPVSLWQIRKENSYRIMA